MKRPMLLLVALLLGACSVSPGTTRETPAASFAAPTAVQAGSSTPSAAPAEVTLIVWIPDDFALRAQEQTQKLLMDRLESFQQIHPGVLVDLRYKNVQQQEDMLDLLSSAERVAPALLPDVVLLSGDDLESAALKGLLVPLDAPPLNPDVFPALSAGGTLQGSLFGIPAAADALLMAGNPSQSKRFASWPEMFNAGPTIGFNFNDPDAVVATALYLSAGGTLTDSQGRPWLDPQVLSQVLDTLRQGGTASLYPEEATVSTWDQVADGFTQGEFPYIVGWYSRVNLRDTSGAWYSTLPGLAEIPATTVTGWFWASAAAEADRLAARQDLLDYLAAPAFSTSWSLAAGYLPAWEKDWPPLPGETSSLPALLKAGLPLPEVATRSILGPILRDAVLRAINSTDPLDEIVTSATARVNQ